MTSKTKQKRLRKAQQPSAADPMALAPVPRKAPSGKTRVPSDHVSDRNADAVALKARARHTGGRIDDMRHPAYGEAAGAAIKALCDPDQANELWALYRDVTRAWAVYLKVCHGRSVHADGANLEVLPDDFEVRLDQTPDLRTPEEKIIAAAARWKAWTVRLDALPECHLKAIFDAWEREPNLMQDGRPTRRGEALVAAMRALAKVTADPASRGFRPSA